MTEQEAQLFTARLTRVWAPEKFSSQVDAVYLDSSSDFEYHAVLPSGLQLDITFGDTWSYSLYDYELSSGPISLRLEDNGDSHSRTEPNEQQGDWQARQEAFAAKWMSFFRRGCWLSGCPIEATTHEKAQWIQGFTYEEIERWNLKGLKAQREEAQHRKNGHYME